MTSTFSIPFQKAKMFRLEQFMDVLLNLPESFDNVIHILIITKQHLVAEEQGAGACCFRLRAIGVVDVGDLSVMIERFRTQDTGEVL